MELLQGSRDDEEWQKLSPYLSGQVYVECEDETCPQAARIFFDLRRRGRTVRSAIGCCIAQLVIMHDGPLLHCDQGFQAIAEVRRLRQAIFASAPDRGDRSIGRFGDRVVE